MMHYKERCYCEDASICATPESKCSYKLTTAEGDRASKLELPVAWSSFKALCPYYEPVKPLKETV